MGGSLINNRVNLIIKYRPNSRRDVIGVAMVEFSLILPLLIFIIIGILYYGYAFVLVSSAQEAAKVGVESAIGAPPLASSNYSNVVISSASSAALNALSWLPRDVVSASANIGSPSADGAVNSCKNTGPDSIVVEVVIKPNAGAHALLPVISIGGYQVPPGLDSVDGQPVVRAIACGRL